MPRPMLRPTGGQTSARTTSQNRLAMSLGNEQRQHEQQRAATDHAMLERTLRKRRSPGYMAAIAKLDAGGHTITQAQIDGIVNALRAEFPDVSITGILQGVTAKCYLGAPFEVHSLDPIGGIVEHYEVGRPMPGALEKSRSLAAFGNYAFIEVYNDCLRAVDDGGNVSVIPV
ncbi:hypothetical protein [Bifidobacterium leontopitheci]|uniref:Uncharacterized protein n=1 Tax=Bifidobacterium leontopitheci TaxID=2650774 RepID=A0A6I1GLJ0_9BIFI|nr:hypothetical protein [Bifidobacterium leontopitheci]KAB7790279.1 hypothetical protein F7D09_1175 [Bifidobacterium leontopitheci]